MAEQKESLKGVWALAITGGTSGILGRLKGESLGSKGEVPDALRQQVFGKPVVQFELALDFFSPLRPQQVMGPGGVPSIQWARDPIFMGHDFTMHPVIVAARWERIEFLADMHKSDRTTYEGFIEHAMREITLQRLNASGIAVPKGNKEMEDTIAAIAASAKNGGPNLIQR